ncbi:asparagine synthetase B family protein [Futiania mangrovi]|uniref:asparagine synthase (glutamine-hydrolyzing) n=1 Tax=Futiania mangrovi TaxID=2959716 RepID=A0A9J6PL73_9PROT|nr:asparagine synthase-related protein [Futiania mangrovii]MCP1337367.1 asparagine synthase-related protein [Futiania mangrovii]
MCGFLFALHRNRPVDRARFEAAFATMRHRGPDAHQIAYETLTLATPEGPAILHVGAGHHRLAILDLDPRSNQPFVREGRMLLYNGEIYNFADLKDAPDTYETTGDTEVLFRALCERGTDALGAMNGMWGFAFLDPHSGTLIAARDRHGKKPLFFYRDADTLCVASTIAAIASYLDRPPVFEDAILDAYLAHGAVFPGGGFGTHIRGIGQVPPGGVLRVSFRDWTFQEDRWFRLEEHVAGTPPRQEDLPGLIADAVRLRLVSDRKVGLLLSGGVDSSIVLAALYAQGLADSVTCFIGETGRSLDAKYARECVEKLGIDATTINLGYGEDAFARFLKMCRHHEKPFPLIGNSMAMSEMYEAVAAHGMVVVLDGTGGDEQFGGYWDRQFPFALRDAWGKGDRAWLAAMLKANGRMMARTAMEAAEDRLVRPLLKLPFVKHPSKAMQEFLRADMGSAPHGDPLEAETFGSFEAALIADAARGRLGEWLWHGDRNAMMSSLENRSPLLDYRISRYMTTGYAKKFVGEFNKHELRTAFDGLVNLPTQWRTEKQGFRWAAKRFYTENRDQILERIAGSQVLRDRVDVPGFLDAARARPRYLTSRLTPRLLCVAGLEETIGLAPG